MRARAEVQILLSPGLREAPVLDRMCSQFVLALTLKNAGRFNFRRDWSNLLSLTGRQIARVPPPVNLESIPTSELENARFDRRDGRSRQAERDVLQHAERLE